VCIRVIHVYDTYLRKGEFLLPARNKGPSKKARKDELSPIKAGRPRPRTSFLTNIRFRLSTFLREQEYIIVQTSRGEERDFNPRYINRSINLQLLLITFSIIEGIIIIARTRNEISI